VKKMRFLILTLLTIASSASCQVPSTAPRQVAYQAIGDFDPQELSRPGQTVVIDSFDLSSDGKYLALLYATQMMRADGVMKSSELSVAVWDTDTRKIITHGHLSDYDVPPPIRNSDPHGPVFDENALYLLRQESDLRISADQNFIVIMTLGKVWVLNFASGSVIYSIPPPGLERVAPVRIHTIGDSTLAITYQYGIDRFQVTLFDLPSRKPTAQWSSDVIPDSFAPDGTLAVAPDPAQCNEGGVTNVQLLDARNGKQLKSIPVHFGFRKHRNGEPSAYGTVSAAFLDDNHVAVVPSSDRNEAGVRSGSGLEIIETANGRVVSELNPPGFGPIGVIVSSRNGAHVALESVLAKPGAIARESLHSKDFTHEVIIIGRAGDLQARIPISASQAGGNVFLRLSSDAGKIAMRIGENLRILKAQ
jgi:hypothetical protein